MTTIFRRFLDKITPWHDDKVVSERLEESQAEVSRGNEISKRTDDLIKQYVLMDTIYKRKKKTP